MSQNPSQKSKANTLENSLVSVTILLSVSVLFNPGCKQDSAAPVNHDPTITSLVAFPESVHPLDSFTVVCSAYDVDGDQLRDDWFGYNARVRGATTPPDFLLSNTKENFAVFYAPDTTHISGDSLRIDVDVRDLRGGGKSQHTFVKLSR